MGGFAFMKKDLKNSNKEVTVKCTYNKDGKDVVEILTASVLLFIIGSEAKNLCSQKP